MSSTLAFELVTLHDGRTTRTKKSEAVYIHFEDISYSVVERGSHCWNREKKDILKNVSGDFPSRSLTGILGPSGCGKTSLLNIISGYRTRGVSGSVKVNGKDRDVKSFIKQSCYIMQDDRLQPLLTVQEAMTFASNVRLESSVTKDEKKRKINDILLDLSLAHCYETMIGSLSGGEKRRLAVALELISDPPVLFLDEPTSGLDSTAARQCVEALQQLAIDGRTVICTIHQPSSSLLNMFNHIYLLTDGYCIYQGNVPNLLPFMASNELTCPLYNTPVEYIIEQTVLKDDTFTTKFVNSINNGKSRRWLDPAATSTSTQGIESDKNVHFATSFIRQLYYLLIRSLITSSRNQILTRMKLIMNIAIGLLLGLFFRDIGNDAGQALVNFNVLFLCVLSISLNALNSRIITFPDDLPVIRREYFNHWYSAGSYFMSTVIADAPIQILCAAIYTSLLYVLTGQPLEWFRIGQFLAITVLLSLLFQDYGILVGTLFDVQSGLIFGLFSISPWLLFSGFFLYYRDAPSYFQWIFKISVLRHGLEGLAATVYGYDRANMTCHEEYCRFIQPEVFLKHVDVDPNNYLINISFISGIFILVKISCFVAVRYKFRS